MNGSTSMRRPHKKASATSCNGAQSTSMARPRHCLNLGDRVQQCRQVAEARHPVELVMRAGNGNELECIARPKGRNVLVTGDLAQADDCDFDFFQESTGSR
jgi:hypothetical protein